MSQLVIEIDTPEDEALLLRLLPKLSARVVSRSIPKPKSDESPVEVLKRIAARGGYLIWRWIRVAASNP